MSISTINGVPAGNIATLNESSYSLVRTYNGVSSIVTTNLQIHYDFQSSTCYPGSGTTVTDLSGNNRTLTFTNIPTWQTNYFDFDGVNDYGTISNIATVDAAGSVGYWVRMDTNLVTTLLQRISGINTNWEFGRLDSIGEATATGCTPATVPSSSIVADLGSFNNTHTNGSGSFTTSSWQNLVFTWNIGGTAKTFVNGVEVHSCAPVNATRTGTWTVGRSPGNTARYYGGDLGWMVYYNTQLSATQVLNNFNATKQAYGY
jgi:hypothetical protein